MRDGCEPDPSTDSGLSAAQRRRLDDLEQHLDTDEPVLAEAMRRDQPLRRRVSVARMMGAVVVGVPLVVLAARVGGVAAAVVTALSLFVVVVVWARPPSFR